MLIEHLFAGANRHPEEVAIIDDRGRYSYQKLAAMASAMGAYLADQTTKPRIGLMLPAGADFVAAFYGTLLSGKTVVPLNFLLGDREIAHCIQDSDVDAIVTIPIFAGRLKDSRLNVVDVTQLPPAPPASQGSTPPLPETPADGVAVLMYTSGTSGLPKGVPLTYGNLQSNVDAAIAHAAFQSRHRFLDFIPLFHVFGMVAGMLAPIQLGSTIIYMARFSPLGALKAIREHHVSLVLGVPSMYAAMARLKEASPADFKMIEAMFSGGEPLPAQLRKAFAARFGILLCEAYGMTETSLAIALNTPQKYKPGSVGTAIPGIQIRIVDEDGKSLGMGEEGEIWVKGPMVTKGYYNLPAETAAAFTSDGFFRTGDLGKIDTDGFVYITGRKKDLIIVAGEKVSPREIEETLAAHPAVAEAAVVGKEDATRGEMIVAFIVAREGQSPKPDELREFCRQHGLPTWKVPREIRIVQQLPRSPTGKVLKRALLAEITG